MAKVNDRIMLTKTFLLGKLFIFLLFSPTNYFDNLKLKQLSIRWRLWKFKNLTSELKTDSFTTYFNHIYTRFNGKIDDA